MKKHLNTLFVTTQGAYLAKEGETIAVKLGGEVRLRLPVHTIGLLFHTRALLMARYLRGDLDGDQGIVITAILDESHLLVITVLGET